MEQERKRDDANYQITGEENITTYLKDIKNSKKDIINNLMPIHLNNQVK